MKKCNLIATVFFVFWSGVSVAEISVYEMVVKGKECKENSMQSISCEYKVGKSLYFTVDGIGDPDTGVTFMKSDFDGDFYATFGVGHGCVIVKSGFKKVGGRLYPGYAFVSPKNGKVYSDWGKCKSGF